jgi:hypothetical protein
VNVFATAASFDAALRLAELFTPAKAAEASPDLGGDMHTLKALMLGGCFLAVVGCSGEAADTADDALSKVEAFPTRSMNSKADWTGPIRKSLIWKPSRKRQATVSIPWKVGSPTKEGAGCPTRPSVVGRSEHECR